MTMKNWTVIVVEDTFDDVELASAILKHYGATVAVAHNGKECLKLLKHIMPDIIVTDLSMPEMDGWEMLRQIRDIDAIKHIPVIAVTAYDSVDVAHDAVNAGFDAYIAKPLSPHTFIEYVEKIID